MNNNPDLNGRQSTLSMNRNIDFSSDHPIVTCGDDLLGRARFSADLANCIAGWRGEHSLVIGLFGSWGCGKTSIKNMVTEHLKQSERRPLIVDFNPWFWSRQELLIPQFFKELARVLPDSDKSEEKETLHKKVLKYAQTLAFGQKAFSPLLSAVKPLLYLTGLGFLNSALDTLQKGAEQLSNVMAEAPAAQDGSAKEDQSISELKIEIGKGLSQLDTPVLIILDDIDRLQSEEIPLLFQLVKINADFPNIVYLLLCDRLNVEKALDGVTNQSGQHYLSKIIQVPINVPHADPGRLSEILTKNIERIVCGWDVSDFDAGTGRDWRGNGIEQIMPFIKSIRDVRRFTSSFAFTINLFLVEGKLEVNLIDLLGLETLRVFEPQLYERIYEFTDILLHPWSTYGSTPEDEQLRNQRHDSLLQLASPANMESARLLLSELFPSFSRAKSYSLASDRPEYMRSCRVCHPDFFWRYFRLQIPASDITLAEIEYVLRHVGSKSALIREFHQLHANGKFERFLDRLPAHKHEIPQAHIGTLVTALADSAEFTIPDWMFFYRILELIKNVRDLDRRREIFVQSLSESNNLLVPVVMLAREIRPPEDSLQDIIGLTPDQINNMRSLYENKLRPYLDGEQPSPEPLYKILPQVQAVSGQEQTRRYVSRLISTPEGALDYVASRVQTYNSSIHKNYLYVKLSDLEVFAHSEQLKKTFDEAQATGKLKLLLYEERNSSAFSAFEEAWRRREAGITDDPLQHDYFDHFHNA